MFCAVVVKHLVGCEVAKVLQKYRLFALSDHRGDAGRAFYGRISQPFALQPVPADPSVCLFSGGCHRGQIGFLPAGSLCQQFLGKCRLAAGASSGDQDHFVSNLR